MSVIAPKAEVNSGRWRIGAVYESPAHSSGARLFQRREIAQGLAFCRRESPRVTHLNMEGTLRRQKEIRLLLEREFINYAKGGLSSHRDGQQKISMARQLIRHDNRSGIAGADLHEARDIAQL